MNSASIGNMVHEQRRQWGVQFIPSFYLSSFFRIGADDVTVLAFVLPGV